MTKFFQHLDILATHAGYITNDNYMIGFLEQRSQHTTLITYIKSDPSQPPTRLYNMHPRKRQSNCHRQAVNTGH